MGLFERNESITAAGFFNLIRENGSAFTEGVLTTFFEAERI